MLKLLHSRSFTAWMLFMLIFVASKSAYILQIPGASKYEDFQVFKYLKALSLEDHVAFAIIVIIQMAICLWIGYFINKLEIVDHFSLIPSTISALLLSVFTTFFRWNGYYVVLLFSLLLIQILIHIKKEKPTHYHCLFAGVCQGSISLIMPTAIIGLPFLHWALYVSKKQSFRGYLLLYLGFIMPFYLFYSMLYILGYRMLEIQYIREAFGYFSGYIEFYDRFAIVPILFATVVFGALGNAVLGKLVFGKRQMIRVLLFYGIGLLLMVPLFSTSQSSVFLLWVFPITLISSILLLRLKKTLLVEAAFGIFVLGIIILSIIKL